DNLRLSFNYKKEGLEMSIWALGIHIGHDRGACLVKDGIVMVSIPQERLDRIKHSRAMSLPYEAIDAVLKYCRIQPKQINCIGLSADAMEPGSITSIMQQEFFQHYQCRVPFYSVDHHLSHAESVYSMASNEKRLILIADGGGDIYGQQAQAESLYLGCNGKITLLEQRLQDPPKRKLADIQNHVYPLIPKEMQKQQISLARKYEQFTYLLGFGFGEAGKTMGLASYGKKMLSTFNPNYQDLSFSLTFGDLLDQIYAKELCSGDTHFTYLERQKEDIAFTVQKFTEKALVSLIGNLAGKYQIDNFSLAGGLFLNCLSNHKILECCHINKLDIFPAAGDDGQAIGNAIHAYKMFVDYQSAIQISLPYLGLSYSDIEIEKAIKSKNLKYEKLTDNELAKKLAYEIANGKIVGLSRGRTEIGPRALCHRSILADATNPAMKDILNMRIKHREEFRPFAPVTKFDTQFKFFDLKADSPFMLLCANVKSDYQNILSSVTHIDNTARIQAVKKNEESFIYNLLTCFEQIKGVPVLLNTSFNIAGQPIVESPESALQTFLSTPLDILVVENYIICKENITTFYDSKKK
ncbi:MAG: hypothetical protein NC548_50200, partial [Lachnospiraceae bacterium]|nr:hypothetical protein [Lachnospiraceae bacterium]